MHQLVAKNIDDLLIVQICIYAVRHDYHRIPHVRRTRRTQPRQLPNHASRNLQSAALFAKDRLKLGGYESGLGYGIAESKTASGKTNEHGCRTCEVDPEHNSHTGCNAALP